MQKRFLIFILTTIANFTFAIGLSDSKQIDSIVLNPQTRQAALILSVDRPLETDATIRLFADKVNAYLEFVKSGQLLERYPNTDTKKAVRFVIVFEEKPSASVSERIKALRAFLIAEKFDVDLKYLDRSKGDVVDFAF
jgi:hypothetical protein